MKQKITMITGNAIYRCRLEAVCSSPWQSQDKIKPHVQGHGVSSWVSEAQLALRGGSSEGRPNGDRAYKDVSEQAFMCAKWPPLKLPNIPSSLNDMKLYSPRS